MRHKNQKYEIQEQRLPDFKSWREPIPHRGLRLWLREDPASPRPTGERARAACRDNSNEDPASPRPTGGRARKEGAATAHAATILILERPPFPVSFWDGYNLSIQHERHIIG